MASQRLSFHTKPWEIDRPSLGKKKNNSFILSEFCDMASELINKPVQGKVSMVDNGLTPLPKLNISPLR